MASATIGEWIARIDVEGWSDAVWLTAAAAAGAAAIAVAARCCRLGAEPGDFAHEAVLVARRSTSFRECPPGTLLVAWFGGVVRNLLRERRRDAQRHAGVRVASRVTPAKPRGPTDIDGAELARRLARLTHGERVALDAANEERSQRDAARFLGVSRRTYRDRLARARCCMDAERSARDERDRAWAARIALRHSRVGDVENAEILRLHAAGWTSASIATAVGKSPGAIEQRLHRFRTDEAVERP